MYQVKTSAARMPSSCWCRYKHVAVIETVDDTPPAMISERAKGVIRIVECWYRCHVGGDRSAYAKAVREAEYLCDQLNLEEAVKNC